jgi:hypothetical protein
MNRSAVSAYHSLFSDRTFLRVLSDVREPSPFHFAIVQCHGSFPFVIIWSISFYKLLFIEVFSLRSVPGNNENPTTNRVESLA